jgi:hypothetical protein
MNLLDRSLIEKTANEHGWENVLQSTSAEIILSSARHQAHARITPDQHFTRWLVELPSGLHQQELSRSFPLLPKQGSLFGIDNYEQLALLLQRSAELATSLPNQAALIFAQKVKQELSEITSFSTEVERVVKQRVGQDTFRQALLNYWEGTCAVTGINLPEILRASHAKPWAECATDEERLNVFNGLLLSANLDALFDRGLISFAENGNLICSSRLEAHQRLSLHLNANQKLRWVAPAHEPFLSWHRNNLFQR